MTVTYPELSFEPAGEEFLVRGLSQPPASPCQAVVLVPGEKRQAAPLKLGALPADLEVGRGQCLCLPQAPGAAVLGASLVPQRGERGHGQQMPGMCLSAPSPSAQYCGGNAPGSSGESFLTLCQKMA